MPTETIAAPTTPAAISREHLRTFHLTGLAPDAEIAEDALRPAILTKVAGLPALETSYPLCVPPDGNVRPLRELVNELEHAQNITLAFRIALEERSSAPLDELAPAVIGTLKECSGAEIARLRKLLPPGASLVAFDASALVPLHAAALAEARQAQRTRFWEDVRHTEETLRDTLAVDRTHAPDAISAESVKATLGVHVASFFKPNLLANALKRPANPLRVMEPERKSRCETTLAMLREALHDAANDPAFFLFHSENPGFNTALLGGFAISVDDSFSAALEFCDKRLERLTVLLRALRVAKLEINSFFDPTIHEEMLARFDWQSASAEELMAIPPIVVWETAERLAQVSLTSFGRLLRSGRPVQILIARTGLAPQDLNGFSPDFGYLAIAHREAFVLQSSLAQLSHAVPGLATMAKTQRTAVAVVAVPEDRDAWLAETLVVWSRTHALYTYDPDAGSRWSERLHLFAPPQSELSPAHAAAVANQLRRNFLLIPASAWSGEQMELSDYLAAYQARPPLAIPYIWVDQANRSEQRALLTRDLVNFCVDRRRARELFEELAAARQPQAVPDTGEARKEGARDAIQQVIAMLSAPDNLA
jgi:hypothetical protein